MSLKLDYDRGSRIRGAVFLKLIHLTKMLINLRRAIDRVMSKAIIVGAGLYSRLLPLWICLLTLLFFAIVLIPR